MDVLNLKSLDGSYLMEDENLGSPLNWVHTQVKDLEEKQFLVWLNNIGSKGLSKEQYSNVIDYSIKNPGLIDPDFIEKLNILILIFSEIYSEGLKGLNDLGKAIDPDIEKAIGGKKDITKLTKKKVLAIKDGRPYLTTVYVKTGETKEEKGKKGHEADILYSKIAAAIKGGVSEGDRVSIKTSRSVKEGEVVGFLTDKHGHTYIKLQTTSGVEYVNLHTAKDFKFIEKYPTDVSVPKTKPVADFDEFTEVKSLGGSSDVKLVVGEKGHLFALKKERGIATGKDQLINEYVADGIYRKMGIPTPESYLITNKEGVVHKVSEYIEGAKTYDSLTYEEKVLFREKAKEGFVLDCLFANWDVVGQGYDNMLFKNGKVYRIDNGSAFDLRAKGSPKEGAWGRKVGEIETFLDGTNPVTAEVFQGITTEDVKNQVKNILSNRKMILQNTPERLHEVLNSRLDYLAENYAPDYLIPKKEKKSKDVLRPDMPSLVTQKYFDEGWDELELEGNPGIKEHIRERIIKMEKEGDKAYRNYAQKLGMSLEEYKAELQKEVEEAVARSEFFIAAFASGGSSGIITKIFQSKRFKSQFEVSSSKGSLDPSYRSMTENIYFGFEDSTEKNKETRPIYGYFTHQKEGVINYDGKIPPPPQIKQYGDVYMKVKRDVAMKKATITFQDSLGMVDYFTATPAAKPHFTSLSSSTYGCPLKELREKRKSGTYSFGQGSYVEAQYHNQLTLNDIEVINVSSHEKIKMNEQVNNIVQATAKAGVSVPINIF